MPLLLKLIYGKKDLLYIMISTGTSVFLARPNPDGIKIFKNSFQQRSCLFEDNFDAAIALTNANMLVHYGEVSSSIDSSVAKNIFAK